MCACAGTTTYEKENFMSLPLIRIFVFVCSSASTFLIRFPFLFHEIIKIYFCTQVHQNHKTFGTFIEVNTRLIRKFDNKIGGKGKMGLGGLAWPRT